MASYIIFHQMNAKSIKAIQWSILVIKLLNFIHAIHHIIGIIHWNNQKYRAILRACLTCSFFITKPLVTATAKASIESQIAINMIVKSFMSICLKNYWFSIYKFSIFKKLIILQFMEIRVYFLSSYVFQMYFDKLEIKIIVVQHFSNKYKGIPYTRLSLSL